MTIPKYNELYDIVLDEVSDGRDYSIKDIKLSITNKLDLTEEEKTELIPSKKTTVINSRVGWAITYLKKAEFLESKKRGKVNITKLGLDIYNTASHVTEETLLENSAQFRDWLKNSKSISKSLINKYDSNRLTYEDEIENVINRYNDEVSNQILEHILNRDEIFFKRMVLDLFLKMGYGILDLENSSSQFNNDGIDAIINEDRLGLNKFAIQAKKYNTLDKIGKSELQSFVGAFVGKGLNKGVFLTNSSFTSDALNFAKNQSIILIDGDELANLMLEFNVGTFTSHTYEIKSVDDDYFIRSD